MKKEKILTIAFIIALIMTLPALPDAVGYVKGPKELGELILAFLIRVVLWVIVIRIALFIYNIATKVVRKLR